MRIKMIPHPDKFDKHESGIKQVVINYTKYLPEFGIDIVPDDSDNFDILVSHAGMTGKQCDVAHLHGLYWTADYPSSRWEYSANANITESVRHAKEITVPSEWVAETLRRDLHMNPHVVPHGIDWELWEQRENQGYVLWNKNRNVDVCDPTPMLNLAKMNEDVKFVSTQLPQGVKRSPLQNLRVSGLVPHDRMKFMVESCVVYLSTTKETFGIGVLEAMAAGVPTLGFDYGGNSELIEHGVTGYLAQPGNMDDLHEGLQYCLKHRDQLGANAREASKQYPWQDVAERVAGIYRLAGGEENYDISVVIPCHNGEETIERTVKSVQNQTYPPTEIIIVSDNSTDNSESIIKEMAKSDARIRLFSATNGNVSETRNDGVRQANNEFICCIDKDDEIAPKFLEACIEEHKKDRSLGIVYTGLHFKRADKEGLSPWPKACDYDAQMTIRGQNNFRGLNQIPTCNVFRKEAWRRAGGYRSRYAPLGAGAEDAELWSRMMALGWGAKMATEAGLFIFYDGGQVSRAHAEKIDPNLYEPHWLSMHPWTVDHLHPFASRATPINKMLSHPVRQYDEPVVSFVVPVGEGHEKHVWEALESIEGQTYRKWEAIVVWDSPHKPSKRFLDAHPYARVIINDKPASGAGYSRNRGAEIARGGFLVFLDADDRIAPEFLRMSLALWEETQSVVYTDYVSSFYTTEKDLPNYTGELIKFYKETGEALAHGKSSDFDCERAQRQPDKGLFHWCLITCLIPKAWHDEIGGFDEKMDTFEDVLYHWAMAYHGYCYVRLPEELVFYRMYSGTRREKASLYTEQGREVAKEMLQYSKKVLEGIEKMGCKKCPGSKKPQVNVMTTINRVLSSEVENQRAVDDNYIKCEYTHPNKGNHQVVGAATGTRYGYFGGGTIKLVHKADIEAQPHFWRPLAVQQTANIPQATRPELGAPPRLNQSPQIIEGKDIDLKKDIPEHIAPEIAKNQNYIVEEDETREMEVREPDFDADLSLIPGLTPAMVEQLNKKGISSPQEILELGIDGLQEIRGIAETRATGIIEFLQNK